MTDQFILADSAAQLILQRTPLRPKIGLVLGSGLGAFADSLTDSARVPYSDIPSFPQSTAIGHARRMVIGNAGRVTVAAMQGRVHQYEGYSAQQVAFPIRVFGRMGIKAVILTNAAGGINLGYSQGALVLIEDHINLQGTNPLVGPNDDRFGVRFPDMTRAYSRAFRQIAREEASKLNFILYEGIYAALLGPSYETHAEIDHLRRIGAAIEEADQAFDDFRRADNAAARAEREVPVRFGSVTGGRAQTMRNHETLSVTDWMHAITVMGLTSKIEEALLSSARDYRKEHGELPAGIASNTERRM